MVAPVGLWRMAAGAIPALPKSVWVETILNGKPSTPFMRFGDRVGIEMHDDDGASIFGRIDQIVEDSNG